MAGILTKDGKEHFADLKFGSTAPQDYWLLLIENGDITKDEVTDDDIQLGSGLTEVSGTGYSRIQLNRGSWTISEELIGGKIRIVASYAQQTFTVGAGGWSNVKGYALALSSTGNDVIAAESFPSGQQGNKVANAQLKFTPRMLEKREGE